MLVYSVHRTRTMRDAKKLPTSNHSELLYDIESNLYKGGTESFVDCTLTSKEIHIDQSLASHTPPRVWGCWCCFCIQYLSVEPVNSDFQAEYSPQHSLCNEDLADSGKEDSFTQQFFVWCCHGNCMYVALCLIPLVYFSAAVQQDQWCPKTQQEL